MEIKHIFGPDYPRSMDGLFSMQYEPSLMNEYERIMAYWRDRNALYTFFSNNIDDLENSFWGDVTIEEAIITTKLEAETFHETLSTYCMDGNYELQYIFQPLYNSEYRLISLQKSKGKIRRSWLRLYALRLDRNCFVITGGAIKLTHNMQATHLQEELTKLERAKTFLKSRNVYFTEDLNTIR